MNTLRVLIVEREGYFAKDLSENLKKMELEVITNPGHRHKEVLHILEEGHFVVAIISLVRGDLTLVKKIRKEFGEIFLIILSDLSETELNISEIEGLKPIGLCIKPVASEEIQDYIIAFQINKEDS